LPDLDKEEELPVAGGAEVKKEHEHDEEKKCDEGCEHKH